MDLIFGRIHVFWAAPAGTHEHDDDDFDLIDQMFNGRKRSARINNETRSTASICDSVDDRSWLLSRFRMERDNIGTSLCKLFDPILRASHTELDVDDRVRKLLTSGGDNWRSKRDFRYEAAILDRKVQPLRATIDSGLEVRSKIEHVGLGDTGRNDDVLEVRTPWLEWTDR